mmetsp:Transcript_1370/g.2141  ORF Transcript_1370/g.2141 Transcript_1370/m.2141 type:complete len:118 (-) Transcript_1370:782-1135(-)
MSQRPACRQRRWPQLRCKTPHIGRGRDRRMATPLHVPQLMLERAAGPSPAPPSWTSSSSHAASEAQPLPECKGAGAGAAPLATVASGRWFSCPLACAMELASTVGLAPPLGAAIIGR